ncbi:hypothetical protein HZY97_07805 [Sphingomonas sp. R-74633]|uniref:hypothetical protein n=1 Tax=Sphingomonas sp. R-74633 TaxID=2751188 RepID=UPI0015D139A4|nr:hypothetical protein [Sphingomonas sp. R-74633]NYT40656.1 hypothetical protein [Sphingomonas sp. R-74633]
MIGKHIAFVPAAALLLGSATYSSAPATAQTAKPAQKAGKASKKPANLSRLIWVRMVPFWGKGWQLKDMNGEDLLGMIRKVKPDVLERFVQFRPDTDMMVPMGDGAAPMQFIPFLNAAMKAGAPGAFITPKVHQNDILSDQERIAQAQAWHDLPVTPRMKLLSLDVRPGHGTADDHKKMLQTFKAQGWDLGFNFAGGGQEVFGLGTYAQAAVSKKTWEVSKKELADMDAQGIKTRLAHIDYPPGITEFGKQTPDRQAEIILKLSAEQHKYGYTFVYPVFYGRQGYDSSKQMTSPDGPYKGVTVLDVIAEAARCDRQYPSPCTPRFPARPQAGASKQR